MYGVILAGGGGSRLWPMSREYYPKQFLTLGGERTLFERTVMRVGESIPPERVMVVTKDDHVLEVKAQIAATRKAFRGRKYSASMPMRILREPLGRNTAPAVGLAAIVLHSIDPSAVMAVMPADHVIEKNAAFARLLKFAGQIAGHDRLVTFGIRPDRPETGFGYIKADRRYYGSGSIQSFNVTRFVEKPHRAKAKRYVESGSYFWNSGIFVWKVSAILAEIRSKLPELYAGLMEIRESLGTPREEETLRRVYEALDSISVDYGILEKSDRVVVVPADIGWSDVGDWAGVHRLQPQDCDGNATVGNTMLLDAKNSMIHAKERLIAAIGVENVFIVDADDAILVCRSDRAQDVKKVIDFLKQKRSPLWLQPNVVRTTWGTHQTLQTGRTFQVKHITVNPGASISLQMHRRRSEHWVVVSGCARVTHGLRTFRLKLNESAYIPAGTRHKLANASSSRPLEVIEVQSGASLGTEDIMRIDDRAGRWTPEPPLTSEMVKFS